MATDFIGSTVLITVRSPPNAQFRGIVQDIKDRTLFLKDVYWLGSGTYMPKFQVPGDILLDLEVVPTDHEDTRPSPLISASSPNPIPVEANSQQKSTFVDPAILSVGKPPKIPTRSDTSATLTEPFSNLTVNSQRPNTSELDTTELGRALADKSNSVPSMNLVASPMQQAFQDLVAKSLFNNKNSAPIVRVQHEEKTRVEQVSVDEDYPVTVSSDKKKLLKSRGRKQRNGTEAGLLQVDESSTRKSKKMTPKKHNSRASEAQNGWATEEATDIQELGEFDFAANLSKFDKREIFKQLKADDEVAAGDRLVGHNRLPKPGTAGGKNLHWTENVLDSPAHDSGLWNSEAGETADDLEKVLDSGRSSARHNSHSRTRMIASRKGSHNADERRHSTMTARQASFEVSGQRKSFTSPYLGANSSTAKPSLRIQDTNKTCPSISPIQMLELEQHAIADLGLNEDIFTENAARGIAEAVVSLHTSSTETTRDAKIVVAVGSHKTGARTLAAARQLRNRGYRVTAVIMGREEEILDSIKQQANALVKAGGSIIKPADLLLELQSGLVPTLLIEALTGMHISLEDLRREDQQWAFELAIWTDRLETRVMSIDVPCGIDPSTGSSGMADGHELAFHPDIIIALGAPKPYILNLLARSGRVPTVLVADISLGRNAWKRLGGKRRTGVDFGTKWVVEVKLQASSSEG